MHQLQLGLNQVQDVCGDLPTGGFSLIFLPNRFLKDLAYGQLRGKLLDQGQPGPVTGVAIDSLKVSESTKKTVKESLRRVGSYTQ